MRRMRLTDVYKRQILRDSARQGKYVISPAVLAADLDALQKKGYTAVTVSDLLAYVQDGADLPEKPVMITFDDGYYNNYIYAYPLLKQLSLIHISCAPTCSATLRATCPWARISRAIR